LSRARLERDGKAAVAARARQLKNQGVTILTDSRDYRMWEKQLGNWAGPDGNRLTPETHAECPGRAVALRPGFGKNVTEVDETWYCTDPPGNGHKKYRHRSPDTRTDEQRERDRQERREVLEGNRAWRAAEQVRLAWLREFARRPKPPAGALAYILAAVASCTGDLLRAMTPGGNVRHEMARDLLGLPAGDGSAWSRPPEVLEALQHAPTQLRAQQIALILVLGAHEAATGVHTWKQGSQDAAAYFQALAGWGYELSDIEQLVITKAAEDEARMAAWRDDRSNRPGDDLDLPSGGETSDRGAGGPENEPPGEPQGETGEAAGVPGPIAGPGAGPQDQTDDDASDVA
jgi:ParB family chromosome partitioning protein